MKDTVSIVFPGMRVNIYLFVQYNTEYLFSPFDYLFYFYPRLETTYRTFYMYAQTDLEANEWVAILKWKLVSHYYK